MDFTTISIYVIYLTTLITGAVIHSPKVIEENNEQNRETRKNNRDTSKTRPQSFRAASQQDYLRQRYAEQQQIDLEEIAKQRRKLPSNQSGNIYAQSTLDDIEISAPYHWQPVQPSRSRNGGTPKEYVPIVAKSSTSKRQSRNAVNSDTTQETGKLSDMSEHIIYVDPRILKQVFELKNKQKHIQSRSISLENFANIDTNSLHELIGKNPHVQLESLKRILQEQRQSNKVFPAIKIPQSFQQKDHTPIIEKTVDIPNPHNRPNVQTTHHELPSNIIPQNGQVITKEAFERIQKQLDESSKFQVHDALLRAQQAAQAHVEAQHKAIEQAQRAILENVQKQLQDSPQALALVSKNIPQYTTHTSASLQHQQPVYPTPLPNTVVSPVHDVTIPTSNNQIHAYKATPLPAYIPNNLSSNDDQKVVSEESPIRNIQIIRVTPGTTQIPKRIYIKPHIKQDVVSHKPAVQFSTKDMEHYAPNHLHQAVAQLQAEKILLQQVQSQNNAILKENSKNFNRYAGEKANEVNVKDEKVQSSANAYQHIVVAPTERQKLRKIHPQEVHNEEQDDLQYAAKYAFGYRIKDTKEGNDFGHEEKRNGRSAKGSYHVLLPDGRRQKVEYYADDNGYHAKVTYENVANHK